MKTLLSLVILVLTASCNQKKEDSIPILSPKDIHLSRDNIYIVLRGSNAKLAGYASHYNDNNVLASHIGLLLHNGTSFTVHHVHTDKKNNTSHLIEESLRSFYNDKDDVFIYASIWELQQNAPEEIRKMQEQIKSMKELNISFDYDFNNKDNNRLYCSEFVYKVLSKSSPKAYQQNPETKAVAEEHRFFLQKDTIQVYPVDFFLKYQTKKLIYEWTSNTPLP